MSTSEKNPQSYLVSIELDQKTISYRNPEIEYERSIALYDLLEENYFELRNEKFKGRGPYSLFISTIDNRIEFSIYDSLKIKIKKISFHTTFLKSLIREYNFICESYYRAIRKALSSDIEEIDLVRRTLHDKGANLIYEKLSEKIILDLETARRFFTLINVLHIKNKTE